MNYIKFDTIESTNDFLKSYIKKNFVPPFFYVYADEQTKGKGQRSNNWKSECCKNILISYFLDLKWNTEKQFLLNKIVSVSVVELLQKFNIPKLKIKHPNDILADKYKISGILIENTIYGNQIKNSIIGIGINVNQESFSSLPFATSLKKISGKNYDREKIIHELTQSLKNNFSLPEAIIEEKYKEYLFKPDAQEIKLRHEN